MQRGSSPLRGALVAIAMIASIGPTVALAQEPVSLTVSVVTADGYPLEGAAVRLLGGGAQAATDEHGRATFTGIGAGPRTLLVQFLGFAPARTSLVLPRRGSAAVRVSLVPRPVKLAELRARAPEVRPLEGTGFYRRRESGIGTFVTRQDIESARPRALSDFLRGRIVGVDLTRGVAGTAHATMRGNISRDCPIQFYLDGVQTIGLGVDDVKPYDVEGMEIYRGAASIPVMFNKGTAACGVIAVWTKR